MSRHSGGFAGKPLLPDTLWGFVKNLMVFIPAAMVGNKCLQGNIWGIPNKKEGIMPLRDTFGSASDRFVDKYLEKTLDTSGFVGDTAVVTKKRELGDVRV